MKLQKKNSTVATKSAPAKQYPVGEVHKNTHRLRQRLEDEGVALLSAGSWVHSKLDLGAAELCRGLQVVPSKARHVLMVLNGDNGTFCCFAKYDNNRYWVNNKLIQPNMLPGAVFRAVPPANLKSFLTEEGEGATLRFTHDKKEVTGIFLGSAKRKYASLIAGSPKGPMVREVEFKKNPRNAHKVARFVEIDLPIGPILKRLTA